MIDVIRARTLCRLGWHCGPDRLVQKYDGGKLPLLCCYCRKVVGWAR